MILFSYNGIEKANTLSMDIERDGGTYKVLVTYQNCSTEGNIAAPTENFNCTIEQTGGAPSGTTYVHEYTITIPTNTTNSTLNGTIEFDYVDDTGEGYGGSISLTQHGDSTYFIQPIWRDILIQGKMNGNEYVPYTISLDGRVIYEGRVYTINNENYNVFINKIIKDYITMSLSPFFQNRQDGKVYSHPDAYRIFDVTINELTTSYPFVYGWDYDEGKEVIYSEDECSLSSPVNGHLAEGQWAFWTMFNLQNNSISLNRDGAKANVTFFKGVSTYACTPEASFEDYHKGYCGRYALYYLNMYGGYDSFLIEGKVTRTDILSRYSINRHYNNNNTYEFETGTYLADMKANYELNTGWLTDSQAENLSINLFGSNEVYLHDLQKGRIYACNVTDTEVEHKSFLNQNKQLVNYTINVQLSQSYQRV